MNRLQRATESVPILGLAITAVMGSILVIEAAAIVGGVLKLLEVGSIYDRLLPQWTAVHYFAAAVIATILAKLLSGAVPDHRGKGNF